MLRSFRDLHEESSELYLTAPPSGGAIRHVANAKLSGGRVLNEQPLIAVRGDIEQAIETGH
jgi:hypothetical protein